MQFDIVCAAFDTVEELRNQADFVCDREDARPVLQRAIDEADRLGVRCILLRGTYEINSHSERTKRGAICFYNHNPQAFFYSQNEANYHVLEGARVPLGYLGGARITMGRDFYNSLSDEEPFSLFYLDGNGPFGRGMVIRNLTVLLPDNSKPVIVFDASAAAAVRYEDCWVSAFDPREVNLKTAEGIPMPHPKSVGFRGCCGSNFYATEWKNLAVQGFGTGFDIGGEHVYCESLSALYNIYGFAFDCYKGKRTIEDADDARALGISVYPIICVNLLDEHNVHMPRFGNASHNGNTPDRLHKSITILGMNLQWPTTCPGHTDRTTARFTEGRHRAMEDQPGTWHGSIEFALDNYEEGHVNISSDPFFEAGHGECISARNLRSNDTLYPTIK